MPSPAAIRERPLVLDPESDPELSERVARVSALLERTGHPVVGAVVLAGPDPRLDPPTVRVEFLYEGASVGVLREHLGELLVYVDGLTSASAWGEPAGVEAFLADVLPGSLSARGARSRDYPSGAELRTLAAASPRARRDALLVVRECAVAESVGEERLTEARELLELEPGGLLASVVTARRVLGLVGELSSGAPAEWASRRFVAEG